MEDKIEKAKKWVNHKIKIVSYTGETETMACLLTIGEALELDQDVRARHLKLKEVMTMRGFDDDEQGFDKFINEIICAPAFSYKPDQDIPFCNSFVKSAYLGMSNCTHRGRYAYKGEYYCLQHYKILIKKEVK